ncbi:MAG: APC family permease [Rhodospirillaceae bacterium]
MEDDYEKNSLTLIGAVSMGTGVMIGAGIFALTGQVAELAGPLFPLSFLAAAIVCGFSAYSYVKMSNSFPSAGGIGMYLLKAYGPGTMTGACALLMAFSMVINESLVARTFGTYTLQLFNIESSSALVPALGVGLIIFAFLINISGNSLLGGFSLAMAILKIGGIAMLAIVGLSVSGFSFEAGSSGTSETGFSGFIASIALSILAYKGFTTITNSGSELVNPSRNVGRAIIFSILICVVIYMLVAYAVGSSLTLEEIIQSKDFALAEAAKPAFGQYGVIATVILAIIATASGLLASVFAVSRMLAMLTDMKLIPHSHFGMTGRIQKHTLVYTVVAAAFLTIFFDLSRIASLGAIFYLVMDIAIHWGILKYLREETKSSSLILIIAIILDTAVLSTFIALKAVSDPLIIYVAVIGLILVFVGEWLFLRNKDLTQEEVEHDKH